MPLLQADRSGSEFYDHLAEIVATEQCQKCIQSLVEAFVNRFLMLNFARLDPFHHIAQKLRLHVRMVRNNKTCNANFLADNEHQIIRSGARLGVIVGGNHSVLCHASEWIHDVESGLEMLSAYVLKVDINPRRSCLGQCLG